MDNLTAGLAALKALPYQEKKNILEILSEPMIAVIEAAAEIRDSFDALKTCGPDVDDYAYDAAIFRYDSAADQLRAALSALAAVLPKGGE